MDLESSDAATTRPESARPESARPESARPEPPPYSRFPNWPATVGMVMGVVGVFDGVYLIAKRHVAACPDGERFSANATDFTCYVHPQAGLGVAVLAISVMLGVLIYLASQILRTTTSPTG